MISIAALLLAAATSQTSDGIYKDSFDAGANCPATIDSPNGPLNLRSTSDIWYYPAGVRHGVHVTDFANIWGHIDALDDLTDWPGVPGASPTIKTIGRYEYVAAKFHVPPDALPTLNGTMKHVMYWGGPPIDVSISPTCGEFNPFGPYCSAYDVPPNDSAMLRWKLGNGQRSYCQLEPDADYFLNIRFSDPNANSQDCAGTTCQTTIQQYLGGF
jgi:hypothetical protein